MHRYGKNVIVSVFDMYQIRIWVGYRYDHTEEYQAKWKKIIVFIPIQLGYAWDTSEVWRVPIGYERSEKKKKNSPNLVSPCLCLSLSVFSFLHFASRLFWLKVLGFYIYIFGYLLLWVCDINYNHIVIDKIINVILFVV